MSDPAERGVLVTGFPGFIGQRLLTRLLRDDTSSTFYLLVEPRFVFQAERLCRQHEAARPDFAGRWRVVVGDLRRPKLAIDPASLHTLHEQVTHVWHLAAVYDLAVSPSVAHAINVAGTRRVLELCESARNLRRLVHVSTCYVAGRREGRIYEDELDCGQEFNNHYESTKFWAEVEVQERWDRIPTTIVRPAIVAGDSTTGVAAKADGPYFMVQLLERLPSWLPTVHFGRSTARFNVVPVDFVVEAMARLAELDAAQGRVFALADPTPATARALMDLTIETLGRARAVGHIPVGLAGALVRTATFQRALPIPAEALAYLDLPSELDVTNTAELLGDQLSCPRVEDYWPTLVRYAIDHPEIFRRAS
jgi:thioester reductase-like protein